ncbi:nuclear transport factor 2 family protein [Pontivivens ytuae]|uniref:Nuclear transport factor 2 family protein n=1 Tax=Pontivivens ytuae TaxID=2789856 RepID=A0A7S9LQ28_9RHOB|nr:nuclear transport factor 2 family protein [Pontivivens ytuae]QPH53222.1 nuclear transport factor 2 family protein [Pontivivens ytuae]
MPIVEAHILEGYGPDDKKRLTSALTDAIRFVVPAPDEAITVMLHEYPPENYARGGEQRTPAPALPDPAKLVRAYLDAMEARDLETARSMLAPEFSMTFPGTGPMTTLAELLDWAKDRYRSVAKTYEAVEAFHSEGAAVVYTRGTLSGEWPDGTPFSGIRFIDRFAIRDGRITQQDVWNDIAEVRAQ